MAIILDADVIIRGEKETFDLRGWLAAHPDEQFEIAAITVAELWHGVQRASGAHKTKRERYLRLTLEGLPIIPYTEATALEHAQIWAALESCRSALTTLLSPLQQWSVEVPWQPSISATSPKYQG